jgi:hypothetical protein
MKRASPNQVLRRCSSLLVIPMLAALSGCACLNEHNRPLTTQLDSAVKPQSTPAKVALAPVAVPVGFCSLLLDSAIIFPVSQTPDAYNDMMDCLWRNSGGGYVRQTFLFLPKVILTPLVFGGAFIGEGYFDL